MAIAFHDDELEELEPVSIAPTSAGPFPLVAWWQGLDPYERVLYRGLGLLAAGLAAVSWPLALIVPGAVVTAIAVASFFIGLRGSAGG